MAWWPQLKRTLERPRTNGIEPSSPKAGLGTRFNISIVCHIRWTNCCATAPSIAAQSETADESLTLKPQGYSQVGSKSCSHPCIWARRKNIQLMIAVTRTHIWCILPILPSQGCLYRFKLQICLILNVTAVRRILDRTVQACTATRGLV